MLTLNIAHGRRRGFYQPIVSRKTAERNLTDIGELLRREGADLVALQEADGPSFWSGNFDHVARLARLAGCGHHFRGEHMATGLESTRLSTGTALLSRLPLINAVSEKFAPSFPTPTKGVVIAGHFVPCTRVQRGALRAVYSRSARDTGPAGGRRVCDATLPAAGPRVSRLCGPQGRVTVASVHLDFLRRRVRRRQMRTLVGLLQGCEPPYIVLGDMNCTWVGRERTLHYLMEMLDVHPHRATARDLDTFPARRPRRRLDWILISPELAFRSYAVLPDRVSDHCAVVAEIALR